MARSLTLNPEHIKRELCNAFCGAVQVHPVASGLAISSPFEDNAGDLISFYLAETPFGFRIEDDGSYLAELIAKGVAIDQGSRSQFLDAILAQANATWDRETLEIRSEVISPQTVAKSLISFLSSLIRIRDLEFLTRENIRSTFREDAIDAIRRNLREKVELDEDKPVTEDLSEFPADLVLRPRQGVPGRSGALYLVTSSEKLNEALLLKLEATNLKRDDFAVIALIEEPGLHSIARKKFQRAQNRSLSMPIFRGDEDAAMRFIAREMKLAA